MACLSTAIALCTVLTGDIYRVVDGDTIRSTTEGTYLRLVYMDTPEKGWRAECAAERLLAIHSTNYLERLLSGGFDVEYTGVMGAWNRPEVRLRLPDGRIAGDVMIADFYALEAPDKTQIDWCGGN